MAAEGAENVEHEETGGARDTATRDTTTGQTTAGGVRSDGAKTGAEGSKSDAAQAEVAQTGARTEDVKPTDSKTKDSKATDSKAMDSKAMDPKIAAAVAAAEAAGPQNGETVRIDSWIWSVRLLKTRSLAAAACRGGHVRLNGERVKPAHAVRVGDEVRVRQEGRERILVVTRLIRKRVGAPVAAQCYIDNSPPPPPREAVAPAGIRDRGAGRPTKRDRRELERLRGLAGPGGGFGKPRP
ncbi:hypothetical protein GCM10027074_01190 [Streptomyces deserti]